MNAENVNQHEPELLRVMEAAKLLALRFNEAQMFADPLQRLTNSKRSCIQINVGPSQPKQLTESQARCNGCAEERFQSLSLCRFKKRLRLLRREHLQLGSPDARSICQRSGIPANESPPHRIAQGCS